MAAADPGSKLPARDWRKRTRDLEAKKQAQPAAHPPKHPAARTPKHPGGPRGKK